MKISKSLIALGISTATVLSATATFAEDGTPSVSTEVTMKGAVPLECAVLQYVGEGTEMPYTENAQDLAAAISGAGTNVGDIHRIQSLTASTEIDFDCNTKTVLANISTAIYAPIEADVPSGLGVVHVLAATANDIPLIDPGSAELLVTEVGVGKAGAGTGTDAGTPGVLTDSQGDIKISLGSTFKPETDGEELPEGEYRTVHTITVTAQ